MLGGGLRGRVKNFAVCMSTWPHPYLSWFSIFAIVYLREIQPNHEHNHYDLKINILQKNFQR